MNPWNTNGRLSAYCMAFKKPYNFDFFIDDITSPKAPFGKQGTRSDKSWS